MPRTCSSPLQRRVVDFSADTPFYSVPNKLQEHYGFKLCPDVIRKITLDHASKIPFFVKEADSTPDVPGVNDLISEADGSMIPIVDFSDKDPSKDKRKTRKLLWKEARLCFSRDSSKVDAIFRATLKSVDVVGDIWFSTAVTAGMGTKTNVHCVGDGAPWIKDQADRVFGGGMSSFLVDFYHVSEYLAAASVECNKEDPKAWLAKQQTNLKEGNLYLVLQELERNIYVEGAAAKEPVVACYRYLTNRMHQLNYLGAILDDLPIGSGEIESGHRHVVQKRMKRAGSWWKDENAEKMLQLMTLRANKQWESYWESQKEELFEEVA